MSISSGFYLTYVLAGPYALFGFRKNHAASGQTTQFGEKSALANTAWPCMRARVPGSSRYETVKSFGSSALCVPSHAAFKTFWRKSGNLLRPYMDRLMYFSLLIFPSTGPLL